MELDKAGYRATFHVHDEVVVEVRDEYKEAAMADITRLMALNLSWTKGLILTADAFETKYYMKD